MKETSNVVLEVRDLSLCYELEHGSRIHALNGISFTTQQGECLGLVGESGSGKSTVAKAVLQLLPSNATVINGKVLFKGQDITRISENQMKDLRWSQISLVTQSAMNALNPVAKISDQFAETFVAHGATDKRENLAKGEALFEMVGLSRKRIRDFPHQFSGGMRQRVIIAMAIALHPAIIIADEPTTALDVIMQAQIIHLLQDMVEKEGISLILITHDISIVAEICDRVGVMYAGCMMEYGAVDRIFENPYHPYTMGLKGAFPTIKELKKSLISIPGSPPRLLQPIGGCGFSERCPFSVERCVREIPRMKMVEDDHFVACHRADDVEMFRAQIRDIFRARTES